MQIYILIYNIFIIYMYIDIDTIQYKYKNI